MTDWLDREKSKLYFDSRMDDVMWSHWNGAVFVVCAVFIGAVFYLIIVARSIDPPFEKPFKEEIERKRQQNADGHATDSVSNAQEHSVFSSSSSSAGISKPSGKGVSLPTVSASLIPAATLTELSSENHRHHSHSAGNSHSRSSSRNRSGGKHSSSTSQKKRKPGKKGYNNSGGGGSSNRSKKKSITQSSSTESKSKGHQSRSKSKAAAAKGAALGSDHSQQSKQFPASMTTSTTVTASSSKRAVSSKSLSDLAAVVAAAELKKAGGKSTTTVKKKSGNQHSKKNRTGLLKKDMIEEDKDQVLRELVKKEGHSNHTPVFVALKEGSSATVTVKHVSVASEIEVASEKPSVTEESQSRSPTQSVGEVVDNENWMEILSLSSNDTSHTEGSSPEMGKERDIVGVGGSGGGSGSGLKNSTSGAIKRKRSKRRSIKNGSDSSTSAHTPNSTNGGDIQYNSDETGVTGVTVSDVDALPDLLAPAAMIKQRSSNSVAADVCGNDSRMSLEKGDPESDDDDADDRDAEEEEEEESSSVRAKPVAVSVSKSNRGGGSSKSKRASKPSEKEQKKKRKMDHHRHRGGSSPSASSSTMTASRSSGHLPRWKYDRTRNPNIGSTESSDDEDLRVHAEPPSLVDSVSVPHSSARGRRGKANKGPIRPVTPGNHSSSSMSHNASAGSASSSSLMSGRGRRRKRGNKPPKKPTESFSSSMSNSAVNVVGSSSIPLRMSHVSSLSSGTDRRRPPAKSAWSSKLRPASVIIAQDSFPLSSAVDSSSVAVTAVASSSSKLAPRPGLKRPLTPPMNMGSSLNNGSAASSAASSSSSSIASSKSESTVTTSSSLSSSSMTVGHSGPSARSKRSGTPVTLTIESSVSQLTIPISRDERGMSKASEPPTTASIPEESEPGMRVTHSSNSIASIASTTSEMSDSSAKRGSKPPLPTPVMAVRGSASVSRSPSLSPITNGGSGGKNRRKPPMGVKKQISSSVPSPLDEAEDGLHFSQAASSPASSSSTSLSSMASTKIDSDSTNDLNEASEQQSDASQQTSSPLTKAVECMKLNSNAEFSRPIADDHHRASVSDSSDEANSSSPQSTPTPRDPQTIDHGVLAAKPYRPTLDSPRKDECASASSSGAVSSSLAAVSPAERGSKPVADSPSDRLIESTPKSLNNLSRGSHSREQNSGDSDFTIVTDESLREESLSRSDDETTSFPRAVHPLMFGQQSRSSLTDEDKMERDSLDLSQMANELKVVSKQGANPSAALSSSSLSSSVSGEGSTMTVAADGTGARAESAPAAVLSAEGESDETQPIMLTIDQIKELQKTISHLLDYYKNLTAPGMIGMPVPFSMDSVSEGESVSASSVIAPASSAPASVASASVAPSSAVVAPPLPPSLPKSPPSVHAPASDASSTAVSVTTSIGSSSSDSTPASTPTAARTDSNPAISPRNSEKVAQQRRQQQPIQGPAVARGSLARRRGGGGGHSARGSARHGRSNSISSTTSLPPASSSAMDPSAGSIPGPTPMISSRSTPLSPSRTHDPSVGAFAFGTSARPGMTSASSTPNLSHLSGAGAGAMSIPSLYGSHHHHHHHHHHAAAAAAQAQAAHAAAAAAAAAAANPGVGRSTSMYSPMIYSSAMYSGAPAMHHGLGGMSAASVAAAAAAAAAATASNGGVPGMMGGHRSTTVPHTIGMQTASMVGAPYSPAAAIAAMSQSSTAVPMSTPGMYPTSTIPTSHSAASLAALTSTSADQINLMQSLQHLRVLQAQQAAMTSLQRTLPLSTVPTTSHAGGASQSGSTGVSSSSSAVTSAAASQSFPSFGDPRSGRSDHSSVSSSTVSTAPQSSSQSKRIVSSATTKSGIPYPCGSLAKGKT